MNSSQPQPKSEPQPEPNPQRQPGPQPRPHSRPPGPHASRDRDQRGRPRSARPRDALGRPLPRGEPGEKRVPDDLTLAPAEAIRFAQRLLDDGRPFHAHEVLEASWKAAPAAERDLWQGLAQLAVGLTHAQRGNPRGAVALLRRGAQRVARYAGDSPYGVDAAAVARWATDLAMLIDERGLESAAADAGRLQLFQGE